MWSNLPLSDQLIADMRQKTPKYVDMCLKYDLGKLVKGYAVKNGLNAQVQTQLSVLSQLREFPEILMYYLLQQTKQVDQDLFDELGLQAFPFEQFKWQVVSGQEFD